MTKDIILERKGPFSVQGGVLVSGDVYAYRIIINMGTDVSAMTAMAVCQENGEFSADFLCDGERLIIVLPASVYNTEGFITVRVAVSDGNAVLTAKEVIFRVLAANNTDTIASTEGGTLSEILTAVRRCEEASEQALSAAETALELTEEKAAADSVYTTEEVDLKFNELYEYIGGSLEGDY